MPPGLALFGRELEAWSRYIVFDLDIKIVYIESS
jgi:hypothetical protein